MYIDRHGQSHEHTHGPHRGGVPGCPECRARNRDSLFRKRVERGQLRRPGLVAERAAMDPAKRDELDRATRNAGTVRYRRRHGRPHDHRYPGKNTIALRDDWLRRGIDPDTCFYCPAPAEHADHYFPRARGGSDDFKNLVPACAPCNRRKSDRLPIEWLAIQTNSRPPAAHRTVG